MKRMKFAAKVLAIALSVLAVFNCSVVSQASERLYSIQNYEATSTGLLVKTNDPAAPVQVTAYMLVDKDSRSVKSNENQYTFYYMGGPALEEGRRIETLVFRFYPYNATVYEETEMGDIWVWKFALENGTYRFSEMNGQIPLYGCSPIFCLDSEYKIDWGPDEDAGETWLNYAGEELNLENENIRLYMMYGDNSWKLLNESAFGEWAKAKEESIREQELLNDAIKGEAEEDKPVEIVNVAPEPTAEPEPTPEPTAEPTREPLPTAVPAADKDAEEERSVGGTVAAVAVVAAFAIAGYVLTKKKK